MRVIHKVNGMEIYGQLLGTAFIPDGDLKTRYGPQRVAFVNEGLRISFGGKEDDNGIVIVGFVPIAGTDNQQFEKKVCSFFPIHD